MISSSEGKRVSRYSWEIEEFWDQICCGKICPPLSIKEFDMSLLQLVV
jgi:hypothetical protein